MCDAKKILAAAKKAERKSTSLKVASQIKALKRDPARALDFLVKAGIADRKGKLTKNYR